MSVSASAVNTNTLTQTAQNGFIKYIEFDELRDLFQDFPIEIAMYDQEGNYKFVNKLYARDEELRKSLMDQNDEFFFNQMGITPDSAVKRKTFFHQALEEKRTIGFTEKLFLPKENKTLYYKRYFRPL